MAYPYDTQTSDAHHLDAAAVGVAAAVGASDMSISVSDADTEEHVVDATCPWTGALATARTGKLPAQQSAQHAADLHEVEKVVGLNSIGLRYPIPLLVLQDAGHIGDRSAA